MLPRPASVCISSCSALDFAVAAGGVWWRSATHRNEGGAGVQSRAVKTSATMAEMRRALQQQEQQQDLRSSEGVER